MPINLRVSRAHLNLVNVSPLSVCTSDKHLTGFAWARENSDQPAMPHRLFQFFAICITELHTLKTTIRTIEIRAVIRSACLSRRRNIELCPMFHCMSSLYVPQELGCIYMNPTHHFSILSSIKSIIFVFMTALSTPLYLCPINKHKIC